MLPVALEYPPGIEMVSVCTVPASGGRSCEHFGGYNTINRIPLPLYTHTYIFLWVMQYNPQCWRFVIGRQTHTHLQLKGKGYGVIPWIGVMMLLGSHTYDGYPFLPHFLTS